MSKNNVFRPFQQVEIARNGFRTPRQLATVVAVRGFYIYVHPHDLPGAPLMECLDVDVRPIEAALPGWVPLPASLGFLDILADQPAQALDLQLYGGQMLFNFFPKPYVGGGRIFLELEKPHQRIWENQVWAVRPHEWAPAPAPEPVTVSK